MDYTGGSDKRADNAYDYDYESEPADGCIEDFENTSEFSRRYQASQKCICDTEHMFDCPEENAHRGPEDIAAVNILANIDGLVSADSDNNPYMDGQKLPVAAKKGNF